MNGAPRIPRLIARRSALAAVGTLSLSITAPGLTRVALAQPADSDAARSDAPGAAVEPLPPGVAAEIPGARLAGAGVMRWFGFRVYSAQLWVGPAGLRPDRFETAPFALKLRYGMTLAGAAIADRSIEEIARLELGGAAQRERWHAAMRNLFPSVSRDQRLTGVNRPGLGAAFYHNGRSIGSIDDPAFAAAFFAIWLDRRTVAPALRSALLQGAGGG